MPGGLAAALLSTLVATAAALPPVATAPPADPMPQVFDPAQSSASFRVRLRVMRPAVGHFLDVRGELQPDGGRQRVAVHVDGRKLHFEGPAWMAKSSRSEDFLDVEAHPSIRFRSAPFKPALLRDGGELRGELTLRGQTREVAFRVLPSACDAPGRGCPIEVRGRVSRQAFGMTAHRLTVRDGVDFEFRVKLKPQATK